MADWFVAQFLDEWEAREAETGGAPKYQKKCLEVDFLAVSSDPTLQCRGPAYPGDVKCRVADRLMNQMHNEFIRLRDWVDLGGDDGGWASWMRSRAEHATSTDSMPSPR